MATSDKFKIEITAEEGRPDGLLSVRKVCGDEYCRVLAYVVSRCRYAKAAQANHLQDDADRALHSKHNSSGVYILWEPAGWGCRPKLYVGQSGDAVGNRLLTHNRDDMTFWKKAVVFTSRDGKNELSGMQFKCIEALMYQWAKSVGRCLVTNAYDLRCPPNMLDADRQVADEFLEEALLFLPPLGIDAFVEQCESEDMDTLFTFVCQQVTWLDRYRVEPLEVPKKSRAPYKLKGGSLNFVTVHREAKQLRITLNIPRDELYDPCNIVEDNPAQNKGTAETMVIMRKKSEWPDIHLLIRQSFERLARKGRE